jgi:hypothetical protein
MTDITVSYVGNIVSESGKLDIQGNIKNMLLDTLYKRTYFWSIVNNKPYTDQYEQTDARMFFQCAMVLVLKQEWNEALAWYTLGSRCFTDSAVIYDTMSDTQCDYNHDTGAYDVHVGGWINTMYGSKQELIKVADLMVSNLDNTDMTGHDVADRMNVLRDEWFTVVAEERKQIAANEAAIKEFGKYDEESK